MNICVLLRQSFEVTEDGFFELRAAVDGLTHGPNYNIQDVMYSKCQYGTQQLDSMMIDYVNRLKELKEDRSKFQKNKDRALYKEKLNKQECKYQTYIIEQIHQKNKIIAFSQMQNILTTQINKTTYNTLQTLCQFAQENKNNSHFDKSNSHDQTSVNFILVKLSTDVIKRLLAKASTETTRTTFMEIQRFSKKKKVMQKAATAIKAYYLRHSFRKMLIQESRHPNQIFDQSFSVISKCGGKEKKGVVGMSESYLSFIIEKQANQDPHLALIITRQKEQIESLQEDLSYLRTLLAQKNIELKKKSQELQNLNQSSSHISQNTSYCNSLQRELTGQKRIRKNTSQLSHSSPSLKGEEISRQLLSKYMKESFQMKEKIDLARQVCLQIHSKMRPEVKREMEALIKILVFGQEESLLDEV